MIISGEKWLYVGKNDVGKMIISGKNDYMWEKWLYVGKMIICGKMISYSYVGKWLYVGKMIICGEHDYMWGKMIIYVGKMIICGKNDYIWEKWL